MKYDGNARIKDEVDLCLDMLGSEYEEAQNSAILHLCRIGKKAVPHLVSSLEESVKGAVRESGYQIGIVQALGMLGDARAIGVLAVIVGKTGEGGVRSLMDTYGRTTTGAAAFEALARIGTSEALEAFISHLDKIESDTALLLLEGFDGVTEALLGTLESGTAAQGKVAAEILGAFKEKRAIPGVMKLLESEDVEVQRYAIEALKQIGDESAVPPMLDFLRSMPREKEEHDRFRKPLRWELVTAIGEIGGTSVVSDLLEEAASGYASGKKAAYEAIAAMGEPAVETLVDAVQKGDKGTRGIASKLIAEIDSKRD